MPGPVMEWLKEKDPVSGLFTELIERATRNEVVLMMSLLNLGEIYYLSSKIWVGAEPGAILERMHQLPIGYRSVTDEQVYSAARLKAAYNISYANAFAASLAMLQACPLVTGDPEFRLLEKAGKLEVKWLGA